MNMTNTRTLRLPCYGYCNAFCYDLFAAVVLQVLCNVEPRLPAYGVRVVATHPTLPTLQPRRVVTATRLRALDCAAWLLQVVDWFV